MIAKIRTLVPDLWDLISYLISGAKEQTSQNDASPEDLDAEELDYWAALGNSIPEVEEEEEETKRMQIVWECQNALRQIVRLCTLCWTAFAYQYTESGCYNLNHHAFTQPEM